MKLFSTRSINLFGLLFCLFSLAGAYYLQYFQNIQPCLLCLLQRWVFVAIAIIFLLAFVHNPGKTGKKFYAFLTLFFSFCGISVAARQVWLQLQPPTASENCVPGVSFLLQTRPLPEVIKIMLQGSDDCARVVWRFMSITLAEWTLIFFVLIAVASLIQCFRR
jgi:disulfide bond formation protein DsbB